MKNTHSDDPNLLARRLRQISAELDDTRRQLADKMRECAELEAELHEHRPPAPVVDAMRSHGHTLRPVRVDIDGRDRLVGIRPTGRVDPAAEARAWRQLRDQAAGGGTAQ